MMNSNGTRFKRITLLFSMNYDDLSKSIVALITIVVDGMYQEEKKNYTKDFPNSGA